MDLLLEELEVDGDEFAVGGFDEVAGVGVGYFHACDRVEPAVVAFGFVALVGEPIGHLFNRRFGAIHVGLGNDEGRTLPGREDAVEPDIVSEDAVAGDDVAQVRYAALRSEVGREGEFYDPPQRFDVEYGMLGLTA